MSRLAPGHATGACTLAAARFELLITPWLPGVLAAWLYFALNALANCVAYLPIHIEPPFFGPLGFARVRKAPVETFPGAEEHRAGFVGLVAHGDYGIK